MIGYIERMTAKRLWILVIGLLLLSIRLLIENQFTIIFLTIFSTICFFYFIVEVFFPCHLAKPEWGTDFNCYVFLSDVALHYGEDLSRVIKCAEGVDNYPDIGKKFGVIRDICGDLMILKKDAESFILELRKFKLSKKA